MSYFTEAHFLQNLARAAHMTCCEFDAPQFCKKSNLFNEHWKCVNARTWQTCSNKRLAYCGSLKSPGQSGKPSTLDRAFFQIVLEVRLIRVCLNSFVVRARRRRSNGLRCPKV